MSRLRDHRGERGATLVETALVGPIVILVTLALIDGGLYFKDFLTVGNATRDGARAGVSQEADALADWDILQAVRKGTAGLDRDDIEAIVIFKATGFESEPTSACKAGSPQSGVCNVYTGADLEISFDDFRSAGYTPRTSWAGDTRDITEEGGTDFLGVYLRVLHNTGTGIFGGDRLVEDTTVMRIEAKLA